MNKSLCSMPASAESTDSPKEFMLNSDRCIGLNMVAENSEDVDGSKTGTLSIASMPAELSCTMSRPHKLDIDNKLHTDWRSNAFVREYLGLAIISEASQSDREQNVVKVESDVSRLFKPWKVAA